MSSCLCGTSRTVADPTRILINLSNYISDGNDSFQMWANRIHSRERYPIWVGRKKYCRPAFPSRICVFLSNCRPKSSNGTGKVGGHDIRNFQLACRRYYTSSKWLLEKNGLANSSYLLLYKLQMLCKNVPGDANFKMCESFEKNGPSDAIPELTIRTANFS